MRSNHFSFVNFYERRIRRIIPILFFVLFICILVQNKVFLYDEKIEFYKIILSITFFISNLWFAKSGSYFEPDAGNNHLLHTWSLSIEEQFYIFFPLFLFFFYKRKPFLILISLFLLSFLLANNGGILKKTFPFYDDFAFIKLPANSFYLLPTRVWELLAGSIIAIIKLNELNVPYKTKIYKNNLVILGYILIFSSFIFFSDNIYHPSIFTLIPVAGISIILYFEIKNEDQSWLERLFNNYAAQKIGLISYSLYLWHLPVLYFYIDFFGPKKIQIYEIIFLIVFSFVLSILSYNFIEKVFRKKIVFRRGKTIIIFVILTIGFTSFSTYKINFYDFKKEFDKNIINIVEEKNYYKNKFFSDCLSDPRKYISPKDSCIVGDNNNLNYAFIGDSHMGIVLLELNKTLNLNKKGGYQLTYNGCLPSDELMIEQQPRYQCERYYKEILGFLRSKTDIKTVVLFYRWGLYYNSTRFNNKEGGKEKGKNHNVIKINQIKKKENNRVNDINDSLYIFLKKIKNLNKEIIIVMSTPEMGWEVPNLLAKKLINNKKLDDNFLSIDKELYKQRNEDFNNFILKNKQDLNLSIYNPEQLFCDKYRCNAIENNYPLFYDDDHLSSLGSKKFSEDFIKFLNNN